MADKKKNNIECPFKDKLKPQVETSAGGRVGTPEDARIEGEKHTPSDADIYGSVAGKRGGGKFGSSGTIMSKDKRRKGKDFNKTAKEAADERHEIQSGEHHIKYGPGEDTTSIVVAEKGLIVQAQGGLNAISVDDSNGLVLQGKIALSSSGKDIEKGGIYTENPQSYDKYTQFKIGQSTVIGGYPPHDHQILPHRHELEPAYLYKMPNLDLLDESFMKQFKSFLNGFQKG
jgi:hypothetical protein